MPLNSTTRCTKMSLDGHPAIQSSLTSTSPVLCKNKVN